jgi:hypothetical protein
VIHNERSTDRASDQLKQSLLWKRQLCFRDVDSFRLAMEVVRDECKKGDFPFCEVTINAGTTWANIIETLTRAGVSEKLLISKQAPFGIAIKFAPDAWDCDRKIGQYLRGMFKSNRDCFVIYYVEKLRNTQLLEAIVGVQTWASKPVEPKSADSSAKTPKPTQAAPKSPLNQSATRTSLKHLLGLFSGQPEAAALVKAFLITRAEDPSFTKYDQQIHEICASENADKSAAAAAAFLNNLLGQQRIFNLAKDLTSPSLKTKAQTLLYHLSRLFDRSAKSPDARNNERAQDGLDKIFNSENTKS